MKRNPLTRVLSEAMIAAAVVAHQPPLSVIHYKTIAKILDEKILVPQHALKKINELQITMKSI